MKKLNVLGALSNKSRRREDRRHSVRRTIKHTFGSEKWVQVVRASYAFWPKEDRRVEERRGLTRRMVERRTRLRKYGLHAVRQSTLRKQIQHQILTEEEKQMLNELNRRF